MRARWIGVSAAAGILGALALFTLGPGDKLSANEVEPSLKRSLNLGRDIPPPPIARKRGYPEPARLIPKTARVQVVNCIAGGERDLLCTASVRDKRMKEPLLIDLEVDLDGDCYIATPAGVQGPVMSGCSFPDEEGR